MEPYRVCNRKKEQWTGKKAGTEEHMPMGTVSWRVDGGSLVTF